MKMIPKHTAIIMDGNGRWAEQKGMPRVFGHQNGVRAVKKIETTGIIKPTLSVSNNTLIIIMIIIKKAFVLSLGLSNFQVFFIYSLINFEAIN